MRYAGLVAILLKYSVGGPDNVFSQSTMTGWTRMGTD